MKKRIGGFYFQQKEKMLELEKRGEEERRKAEEKEQEVKKLSEDVTQFKRMMAHNVRMPLAVISGYGELLLNDGFSSREEELDCIRKICSNIEYLVTLTKVLLDDEPEDTFERMEVFDLLECINTVAEYVKTMTRKAGIDIAVNSSKNKVMFYGNRISLMRGFFNLVENSIRYMNRRGSIVITVEETDKEILIVYRDDGEGMNPEEALHMTELSYQGSNKKTAGHGIGMYLFGQMVEKHGGSLTVKTSPGNGMGIYTSFPRSRKGNL